MSVAPQFQIALFTIKKKDFEKLLALNSECLKKYKLVTELRSMISTNVLNMFINIKQLHSRIKQTIHLNL